MGLNIVAYSKLVQIEEENIEFGDYGLPINQRIRSFFSNPDYPYHISGIESNHFYLCKGEVFGFRAGSYKTYNDWRSDLARLIGFNDQQQVWKIKTLLPFGELINFSDRDGSIGSIVASKLFKDFLEYDQLAKEVNIPFFYEKYQDWKRACEIASKNGAIIFE